MNAQEFNGHIYQRAIDIASEVIEIPRSKEADQLLLTIAGQESAWQWRYQLKHGGPEADGAYPARGWWQFEKMGGVAGVLKHRASRDKCLALCDYCAVYPDEDDIWRAMEGHDILAAGMARLLLWTDPRPLPTNQKDGWDYYIANWRPGKPHPNKWAGLWADASSALSETA
jgi:hypothetical protein